MSKVEERSNPGPIIGGVVAAVVVIAIVLVVLFSFRRRIWYVKLIYNGVLAQ